MPRIKREPIDRHNIDPTTSYSVLDVAHLVGWTPRWLRQLIREGKVQAFRPNGHEYRVHGAEVKRLLETLERHGSLPRLPSPLDNAREIPISAEQLQKIDPSYNPETSGPEGPARKGFWERLDDDVREGFPLLFEGESS